MDKIGQSSANFHRGGYGGGYRVAIKVVNKATRVATVVAVEAEAGIVDVAGVIQKLVLGFLHEDEVEPVLQAVSRR
jgi:hypothetical protein